MSRLVCALHETERVFADEAVLAQIIVKAAVTMELRRDQRTAAARLANCVLERLLRHRQNIQLVLRTVAWNRVEVRKAAVEETVLA